MNSDGPVATRLEKELPPHGSTGAGNFALGIRADDLNGWRQHLIVPVTVSLTAANR